MQKIFNIYRVKNNSISLTKLNKLNNLWDYSYIVSISLKAQCRNTLHILLILFWIKTKLSKYSRVQNTYRISWKTYFQCIIIFVKFNFNSKFHNWRTILNTVLHIYVCMCKLKLFIVLNWQHYFKSYGRAIYKIENSRIIN